MQKDSIDTFCSAWQVDPRAAFIRMFRDRSPTLEAGNGLIKNTSDQLTSAFISTSLLAEPRWSKVSGPLTSHTVELWTATTSTTSAWPWSKSEEARTTWLPRRGWNPGLGSTSRVIKFLSLATMSLASRVHVPALNPWSWSLPPPLTKIPRTPRSSTSVVPVRVISRFPVKGFSSEPASNSPWLLQEVQICLGIFARTYLMRMWCTVRLMGLEAPGGTVNFAKSTKPPLISKLLVSL